MSGSRSCDIRAWLCPISRSSVARAELCRCSVAVRDETGGTHAWRLRPGSPHGRPDRLKCWAHGPAWAPLRGTSVLSWADRKARGDSGLACGLISLLSPSSPHPCLLSHMLLALNAQSRGAQLCQAVGKVVLFTVWHRPAADSFVIPHCGLFRLSCPRGTWDVGTGMKGCGGCSPMSIQNEGHLLVPFAVAAREGGGASQK